MKPLRRLASGSPLPTLTAVRRTVRRVSTVVSDPTSVGIVLAVAAGTLFLFVVPENYRLVRDVVVTGDGDFGTRLRVFGYLLPLIGTIDPIADAGLLVVSLLSGIVVATVRYQFRATGGVSSTPGGAGIGVALGVVGGGCAACGSAILAAAFGTGAAGFLAILPFGGAEIPWIAAGILALSLARITREFEPPRSDDDR